MHNLGNHLITQSKLQAVVSSVGVRRGDTVCVHTALSRLGYVCGGARAIIEAVRAVIGKEGTIMMPAYTRDTADPREWKNPPAPEDWLNDLLAETPPYDPKLSPTQGVGAVAELFRTYPGILRSGHPISSVAAIGPNAETLTANVPLHNRFGEDSAYGRLVRLEGKVVMLGAPYETMSLLHLSQYRMGWSEPVVKRACMMVDGRRHWVQFNDVRFPHEWAARCVDNMVYEGVACKLPCGESYVLMVPAKDAVEFAIKWRKSNEC